MVTSTTYFTVAMDRLVSTGQRVLSQINLRNRRVLLLIFCICFSLYMLPAVWRMLFSGFYQVHSDIGEEGIVDLKAILAHNDDSSESEGAIACMQATLSEFQRKAEEYEVAVWVERSSKSKSLTDIPNFGNGYVAVAIEKMHQSTLQIKRGTIGAAISDSLPTNINILSRARVGDRLPLATAYMTLFGVGTVKQYAYYGHAFGQCLEIEQELIAHRVYPWLVVQSFTFRNNLPHAVEVRMENSTISTPMQSAFEFSRSKTRQTYVETERAFVFSAVVDKLADHYALAVAQNVVEDRFTLQTSETKSFSIYSAIQYTMFPSSAGTITNDKSSTAESTRQQLERDVQSKLQLLTKSAIPVDLMHLHQSAWQLLLSQSTFSIARSHAAEALNGDRLNATRYAVLSNIGFPQVELDSFRADGQRARTANDVIRLITHKSLDIIESLNDGCFSSHPTLLSTRLWSSSHTARELFQKVKLWILTLVKQGCEKLILNGGAYGTNHAFLLSLGGVRFKSNHLEMNVHPSELQRNMQLSNVVFDNATLVNISVLVDEESSKAFLYVSSTADRSRKQLYACDGGCLDAPVAIGPTPAQLPVKLTEPLTAVLYIAADRAHIEELKQTLHLRDVHEADPHPQHVLAEHKHGHRLGGLPIMFWISIGLFVVLFHLFLIRILINECAKPTTFPERTRRFRYYAS